MRDRDQEIIASLRRAYEAFSRGDFTPRSRSPNAMPNSSSQGVKRARRSEKS